MLEHWPIEYADQLILGNPSSNIGVCCLWSRAERVKEVLDPAQYAIIGNLYSRAGISPMLRNILAKPILRYLILVGKSLTDSDEAILDFFQKGVDEQWRIIGNGGQVDRDLPLPVLEDIRHGVQLIDLRHSSDLATDFGRVASELKQLPPFAEPRVFPKSAPSIETFPSEFLGFVVRGQTIIDAWHEALRMVMTFGHICRTDYGIDQREILGLLSVIENPEKGIDCVPDWAPFRWSEVEAYVAEFLDAKARGDVAYNYGHRLQSHWGQNQIEILASELRRSKYSRRAVASTWDPAEDARSSEPPCLTTIQAVVRHDRLCLMAYIRSNDMFRAYPLNAAALAQLQLELTRRVDDVELGHLAILSFSAHIYSDCWDACRPALEECSALRKRFTQDPRGSFVFCIEEEGFAADHYSPSGDLVQTLRAADVRSLRRLMRPFVSRVDHAFYLGKEMTRVQTAKELGCDYTQDEID